MSPDSLRFVEPAVDAGALLVDDLVEPVRDVFVDAAEVVAVELLAPLLAQLLEHLAHALHVAALPVGEALLHHAPERGVEVAVVEEVVGHLLEQRVGVEIEADLRAVPAGVLEPRTERHVRLPVPPSWRSPRISGGVRGASSTQAEGAAPARDWFALEKAGRVPPSATATDSATRYAEDFALYAAYGLTHHRLSIEWARIEPEEGRRDAAAIEHYSRC